MADQKTITTIIFIVFAGVCYGAFYAYYHRRLAGDLLRAILSKNALSEESAVTLDEIGYKKGIKGLFARFVLKKGSAARKVVCAVYEEKAPEKKHEDELFVGRAKSEKEQKYYIPEDKRMTVEVKYDGRGISLPAVFITVAVFFAACLIAVSVLPSILSGTAKLLGNNDPENSGYIPEEKTSDDFGYETEADENEGTFIETVSPETENTTLTKINP
jgi:hypothetical protein